ncbi:MAG: 50S ribosomal protein L10 [Clostridia bacterium]|nr:50S ribosomal protein L10 [Clostridia bacterium]MBR2302633.1 50S ribosomal protein L10 [Clostridia bacterium]
MNANKIAKREIVDQIKDKIQRASSFVILDYKGLTVAEDTQLRNEFRKAEVEYRVLKNTLVKIALNELGYTDFDADLNGPTAVAFSYGDAIAPSKVAAQSIKKLNKMSIKCGMLDGKYVDEATVQALSKVPNKETLLAMLLSVLQAPIRGLAVALNEIAKKAE